MKLNKKFFPSWKTNKYFVDIELYNRLCDKSKQLFGSKWYWRKIAENSSNSLLDVELEFDRLLSFINKKLEEKNVNTRTSEQNTTINAGRENKPPTSEVIGSETR
jgi:hypothetical protein